MSLEESSIPCFMFLYLFAGKPNTAVDFLLAHRKELWNSYLGLSLTGQGKMRVASCKLLVASCELQVASCTLRVTVCELHIASPTLSAILLN